MLFFVDANVPHNLNPNLFGTTWDTVTLGYAIRRWMEAEISKEEENWKWRFGPRICTLPDRFYFYSEEDRVKFILRWM